MRSINTTILVSSHISTTSPLTIKCIQVTSQYRVGVRRHSLLSSSHNLFQRCLIHCTNIPCGQWADCWLWLCSCLSCYSSCTLWLRLRVCYLLSRASHILVSRWGSNTFHILTSGCDSFGFINNIVNQTSRTFVDSKTTILSLCFSIQTFAIIQLPPIRSFQDLVRLTILFSFIQVLLGNICFSSMGSFKVIDTSHQGLDTVSITSLYSSVNTLLVIT